MKQPSRSSAIFMPPSGREMQRVYWVSCRTTSNGSPCGSTKSSGAVPIRLPKEC
jgi:hypothetical protein